MYAVLALLSENISRNGLTPERCCAAPLEWGEARPAGAIGKAAPFEVVLASDVIYPGHDQQVVECLFKSVVALMGTVAFRVACDAHELAARSGVFVCSYVPRAANVTEMIFTCAAGAQLTVKEVPWQDFMPTPPPLGAKLLLMTLAE